MGSFSVLERMWARSDALFACLQPEALLARPIPLRQPFVFYLGHLPAFACNQVWRGALRRAPVKEGFESVFERGIDPPDTGTFEPDPAAAWPPTADVLRY